MMIVVCTSILLLSHIADAGKSKNIINGAKSTIASWPWIVSIRFNRNHFCGGTLIGERWVLTAAHCFHDKHDIKKFPITRFSVMAGRTNLSAASAGIMIDSYIEHENFNFNSKEGFPNDIAVVKLKKKIQLSPLAKIINLPACKNVSFEDMVCKAAGWGMTHAKIKKPSPFLLEVTAYEVNQSTCNKLLKNSKVSKTLHHCIIHKDQKSSPCIGDSGGPVVCQPSENSDWILAGISSWGDIKCSPNLPSVNTRVSAYVDWIIAKTGLKRDWSKSNAIYCVVRLI